MKLKIITSFILLLLLSSCHVGRYFIYNFAGVSDYKIFPQITVHNDPSAVFRFKQSDYPLNIDTIHVSEDISEQPMTIAEYHSKTKTTGFLIIRNDTVLYENYFGLSENQLYTSFSVSKSFVGALIGIALDEGKIQSVDDPMTNYIDYWNGDSQKQKITVSHLLDMKSGITYNENYYNPFGDVAKFYYGRHLERYLGKMKTTEEPGKEFEYVSVNTLLLSLILEKASGMTTAQYLEEKLWKPLGMENNATVNYDRKNGVFKAFCGLNATLKDYAKFGRLYLHWGKWEGRQIISKKWVERVRTRRPSVHGKMSYADQWWIVGLGDFCAIGFLGQYIYVHPEKNLIIVRTGETSENWLWLLKELANSNVL
jgi:CubicO group peptidase (beta-lactamase class C family)